MSHSTIAPYVFAASGLIGAAMVRITPDAPSAGWLIFLVAFLTMAAGAAAWAVRQGLKDARRAWKGVA